MRIAERAPKGLAVAYVVDLFHRAPVPVASPVRPSLASLFGQSDPDFRTPLDAEMSVLNFPCVPLDVRRTDTVHTAHWLWLLEQTP